MNIKSLSAICIFSFFSLLLVHKISAQDFYNINNIQEIKIYFTQPNWNSLLVTAAGSTSEPFTICKKVIVNGTSFDSVGVKYKGNSTFSANRKKNPWHIELDNVKTQDYLGYKDIKLSNIFQDPSCVREALSYGLMQPYTNLPRANYAKVWVNDTLIGLYTNVEAVTKSFCKKHFSSSNGNVFVKGTPPSLSGSGGGSSLQFKGTDTTKYYKAYEILSNYGWKELADLCDTLNNKPTEIENILDVDHTLWMLAFNVLFVNLDSYTGSFIQNYYLWRDDNKRFKTIIWDLNMSFASFTSTGMPGGIDSMSLAKLSPYIHDTSSLRPLISKLLSNPRYKKMFLAHFRTMYNECFKNGLYITKGEAIRNIIDAAVQSDKNNLSTYALFKSNFYYGATGGAGGPGGGNTTGIVSLMTNRMKYLDTLTDMKFAPPTISNINGISAIMGQNATVTAKIVGNLTKGVFIGYRTTLSKYFVRIEMYDDGNHNDGNANDNTFGAIIPMSTPIIEYYIWAENAEAGIFSPERSEHEYYQLNAIILNASDIVINEIMASNTTTATDPNGEYDDWIELYNKSSNPIDIGSWHISDDATLPRKWKIPKGTIIPGDGYLIIWADEDSSQNTALSLHANFKLSGSGEQIFLYKKDSTIADQLIFGIQKTDFGYARRPNGTGSFVIQTPTFNKNNNSGTNAVKNVLIEEDVFVYPNPASENNVNIEINCESRLPIIVFDVFGKNIYSAEIFKNITLETHHWPKGMYIIKVGNVSKKLVVL